MANRKLSDEHYVIDLCEEVLSAPASRQHRFDWLEGDPSEKTGRRVRLPVDGYWEALGLVVEYAERQHGESVTIFDKPDVLTVSGVHRGLQRAIYDQRRRDLIPAQGLVLVEISVERFTTKSGKIVRDHERDLVSVREALNEVMTRAEAQ